VGPSLVKAAVKGISAKKEGNKFEGVRVGRLMYDALRETECWHHGGNTNFGIIMLFVPLAVAAGAVSTMEDEFTKKRMKTTVKKIISSMTVDDTIYFTDAVREYVNYSPSEHEKHLNTRYHGAFKYNILASDFKKTAKKEGLTLFELFKRNHGNDSIVKELLGWHYTFEVGFPTFKKGLRKTKDINTATVHTHLKLLSHWPNYHKHDKHLPVYEKIKGYAMMADQALKAGGMTSNEGRNITIKLDKQLDRLNINTGGAADFTAASLYVAMLQGMRP